MSIDFLEIEKRIEQALQKVFARFQEKLAEEIIVGYALYTDASVMSISSAVNTKSHLLSLVREDPEDAEYYRWSPAEWAYEAEDDSELDEISSIIRKESNNIQDFDEFNGFRWQICEVCVKALESLVRKKFFRVGEEVSVIVFTMSDTDIPDREIEWINRLNDTDLSSRFRELIQDQ